MKYYQVYCGQKFLKIEIPEHIPATLVEAPKIPSISNINEEVKKSLKYPIGSKRLKELVKSGQKVVIVVTDITRKLPEEIILRAILDELKEGGIKEKDISAVVATGTHRPNTLAELREKFGEIVDKISFFNHNAWDKKELVHLGYTKSRIPLVFNKRVVEADFRISTGVIEPHLFAGYSGGVKSIAVGIAGEETIAATHNYQMLQETHLGVVEGNEFRRYLAEATTALGLHFIVNVVKKRDKEVMKVVAGDPIEAFHEGVKIARQLFEVKIENPGDIVISGVSYPKSRDLYQATRAANGVVFGKKPVVNKGGVIIIPAPCEDGFGHLGYCNILKRAKNINEIIKICHEEGFAPGEQKALILGWILRQARIVITDCLIPKEKLEEIHLESGSTLQESLNLELAKNPKARVIIIPDGLSTIPVIKE